MNFKCPFHNDINASLSLKNKKFICYGCKTKGKISTNFVTKKFDFFFDKNTILNAKKNFYIKKNFWLKYLIIRNINMNISLKFNLGLLNFSYKKINQNIFFNRLIFPILNENNILIGIGLKTNNKKNKYLNIFKNNINNNFVFFGINNIKNFNFVIIVEGYFDLLTIYKNNFINVICLLGCNINFNKINFLLFKFKKIYFCLDGDYAGYFSSEKIKQDFKIYYKKRIFIKNMPKNLDPDSFINLYGIKSFLKYLIK
ncbi:toprim domain-containing protein [Candidatus Carsonella ruddii]|uniref:toprim domain-containing protein n=1 Tax=Carsonella ruddii TaxID=114186 RepID=UPI003D9A542C